MNTRKWLAVASIALIAASCSSSKKAGTGSGGGNASHTITVGLLGDFSGPAASGNKTSDLGLEAGAYIAAQKGWTIKFVKADTQTSPAATLTAAQKLVQEDHVSAVLAVSAVTTFAADFLHKNNVPVIGVAEDGSEWTTDLNMFSTFGFIDETTVGTTFGDFMKMEGVTTVGSLGYAISQQSALSAKGSAASAQHDGLKVGYLNANFPFGGTNVAPVALAMKTAGVDGFTGSVDPNTMFALIAAMRQNGSNFKAALMPTGYGGDLAQAGPGALQTAQGVYFDLVWEPVEMNTAATQQFQTALKSVGVTGDPTYAEYAAYSAVALLTQGLTITGPNPSAATLISALSTINSFDSWGLFGDHHIDYTNRASSSDGVEGCIYVTKLQGSAFELVPNADPICGTTIAGLKVS